MKQTFLMGILIFLIGSASFANGLKNPLQRTCAQVGGQFWIYGAGEIEQWTVCRLGTAEIGALDLVRLAAGEVSDSVQAFLSSASVSSSHRSCVDFHAGLQKVIDTDGRSALFCVFGDGSLLKRETLLLGTDDSQNARLKSAIESL